MKSDFNKLQILVNGLKETPGPKGDKVSTYFGCLGFIFGYIFDLAIKFQTERLIFMKGDPGIHGVAGIPGAKGGQGEIGLKGVKGAKGETGRKGQIGQKGERGWKGQRGGIGAKGAKGERGRKEEVGCDSGWKYFPHTMKCYKYFSQYAKWKQASTICEQSEV